MRLLVSIFCLIICFETSAQERISTIEYEGISARYFVQEVDNVNYIIKITIDDELQVFILNDDFTISPFRSKVYSGIYDDLPKPIENLIYTFDDRDPIIYDFISDSEIRYTIPGEWFPQYWSDPGSRRPTIGTTNDQNNDWKRFIVKDDGSLSEGDSDINFLGTVCGNYAMRATHDSGEYRSFFAENLDTGQHDTLYSGYSFRGRRTYTPGANHFLYLNDEGNPCRFNGEDGTKDILSSIVLLKDEFESYHWSDSYFYLITDPSDTDEHLVEIYDLDGKLIAAYEVSDQLGELALAREIGDYLFFGSGYVYVVDLEKDTIVEFPAFGFGSYPHSLIDDRYFLSYKYPKIGYGYSIFKDYYIIDLLDLSETMVDYDGESIRSRYYSNTVKVGEDFVGVFWSDNSLSTETVYRISIDDALIDHLDEIDNDFFGLPSNETTLFKFDGEMVLASRDIFSVDGDSVEIVNTSAIEEINYNLYHKHRDNVTYATKASSSFTIHSYDGDTLISEAIVPLPTGNFGINGIVKDYVVTDDNLFYILDQTLSFQSDLMRFEKATRAFSKISEADPSDFKRVIGSNGNDVYFLFQGDLYHVNKNGDLTKMIDSQDEGLSEGTLMTSLDNIYFLTGENLYHLNGVNYDAIYSGDLGTSAFLASFDSDPHYNEHSLFFEVLNDSTFYYLYVRDDTARKIDLGGRVITKKENDGDYFIIKSTPANNDNIIRTYLYSGLDDELYDLTSLDLGFIVFNIHFVDDVPYIVSKNNISREMYIHRMNDDFSTAELLYTIPNSVGSTDAEFEVFGIEGMLYSNDHIFLMEQGYNLHEQGVKGTGQTSEMYTKDGFVYFIAVDPDLGNQVFRTLLFSFRVSTDDIRSVEKIAVFPNPASSVLNIPVEATGDYTILNQLGQVLSTGDLTNHQINISLLQNGLHYLKIENKEEIFITTFVKGE